VSVDAFLCVIQAAREEVRVVCYLLASHHIDYGDYHLQQQQQQHQKQWQPHQRRQEGGWKMDVYLDATDCWDSPPESAYLALFVSVTTTNADMQQKGRLLNDWT
jgi:hypothetical protein